MSQTPCDVKDLTLSGEGVKRIEWALQEMPVLRQIMSQFAEDKPLKGLRISGCLHITTETANLVRTLEKGGADVVLCASNPLSTQDDVAAALVSEFGIPVYAIKSETTETYYQHIQRAIDHRPQITMDDGADLVSTLHQSDNNLLKKMIGGTEETTTGVIRLRAMANENALHYPVIAVNDAMTKHLFDNRYGTGQSTLDGIIRATNILLASKVFTIVGYGWCGRGIAMRAKGHGARVVITEVDPLRALEASMDGFTVMTLLEAVSISDFVVTATGDKHVVDTSHFAKMKDGCILANSGHFNVEVNIPALKSMAVRKRKPRQYVEEYYLNDGRRICLLAEGRLVNLSAAEGHPAAVMDMSFANQALSVKYLYQYSGKLENRVHDVPVDIDEKVAKLKLASMGINIDSLTNEQKEYLSSWHEGT
ncbi:MAG: adenosylhomocysteinase [Gammaproteobacteria bacterium]|nr:adenosylhomocysteinase [Gammaproteobacteria bacterium]